MSVLNSQDGQLENKMISNKGLIGRTRRSSEPEPEIQPGTGVALARAWHSHNYFDFLNVNDACLTFGKCKH